MQSKFTEQKAYFELMYTYSLDSLFQLIINK